MRIRKKAFINILSSRKNVIHLQSYDTKISLFSDHRVICEPSPWGNRRSRLLSAYLSLCRSSMALANASSERRALSSACWALCKRSAAWPPHDWPTTIASTPHRSSRSETDGTHKHMMERFISGLMTGVWTKYGDCTYLSGVKDHQVEQVACNYHCPRGRRHCLNSAVNFLHYTSAMTKFWTVLNSFKPSEVKSKY